MTTLRVDIYTGILAASYRFSRLGRYGVQRFSGSPQPILYLGWYDGGTRCITSHKGVREAYTFLPLHVFIACICLITSSIRSGYSYRDSRSVTRAVLHAPYAEPS
jgi:hypothetical protein